MKSIKIKKTLNFTNGSIEIKYNGTANDNADLKKINTLLENFINNHNHTNMIENVSILRTIFKDCEEKSLTIFYQDKKGSELVRYDNSGLTLYERSKKEENNEDFYKYKIKYEPPYGISLNYNNHKVDVVDYLGIELASQELTEMMKQIYYLRNAKAIILDKEDKTLIETYKLFYNENPNFSDKDINIRVQSMLAILAEFGISLGDDYGFRLCGKEKMTSSLYLEQRINRLYPLGEVDNVEDNIEINDKNKKVIKTIGECIRESIPNEKNQNKALITISNIIHDGKYCLSYNCDVEELSKFTEHTNEEIESSIKLIKNIETKINKTKR